MFSSTSATLFQELLAEQRSRSRSLSLGQRLGHTAVLLLAWALSLSTVLVCMLAVYYLSEHMHVVSATPHHGISCPAVGGPGWGTEVGGQSSPGRQGQPSCSSPHGTSVCCPPQGRRAAGSRTLTLVPTPPVQQDHRAQGSGKWQQEAMLLVLPLVVSLLNVLMPRLYNLLAMWEKHDSPVAEVYVAICR